MRIRLLAAVTAVLLVGACGTDDTSDPDPDPTETATSEPDEDGPLSRSQVRAALLTVEDLPAAFDADLFEAERIDEEAGFTEDDFVSGFEDCGFLAEDDPDSVEPAAEAEMQLVHAEDGTTIYTSVESYEPGDAEQMLDDALDRFERCETFEVRLGDGSVVEGRTRVTDDDEVGDRAVELVIDFSLDGEKVIEQSQVAVLVGDDVTITGLVLFGPLEDGVFADLLETAVEKLEDARA